ncbi:MAG: hypothetical protein ACRCXM_14020 [Beijerinckiaceae bacterium]
MKTIITAAAFLALSITAAAAQTTSPVTNNPLRRPAPAATQPSTPAVQPAQPVASQSAEPKARRGKPSTGGNFAERRTRCSSEWKEAKAANKTGGQKWPQFWSACNTRLKAAGV